MASSYEEIQALMNLFDSKRVRLHDSDSEDEIEATKEHKEAKNFETNENQINPYKKVEPDEEKKKRYDEITQENDFFFDEEKPSHDWKKTPKWNITYKQQVTASDVFLQLGPKNPSTACCENMIVEIFLPKDKRQNIDLKVKQKDIQLDSPNHYLDIPLPHPVDPQQGNAQWDSENEKLIITLKMEREFDFVNF